MNTFTIGEEVMFGGERYIIASLSDRPPYRYHLLRTTEQGTKFIWANEESLQGMKSYVTANNDTARYKT